MTGDMLFFIEGATAHASGTRVRMTRGVQWFVPAEEQNLPAAAEYPRKLTDSSSARNRSILDRQKPTLDVLSGLSDTDERGILPSFGGLTGYEEVWRVAGRTPLMACGDFFALPLDYLRN